MTKIVASCVHERGVIAWTCIGAVSRGYRSGYVCVCRDVGLEGEWGGIALYMDIGFLCSHGLQRLGNFSVPKLAVWLSGAQVMLENGKVQWLMAG